MDPINPTAPTAAPANTEASAETLDLTSSFLSGNLPFQGDTTPAAVESAVEAPGTDVTTDTFEAQSERMGWNKDAPATTNSQPATPTSTPAQPSTTPAQPLRPGARDYNNLPPEDVAVFKQMSNEAYARLRPLYDQHREWEAKKAEREAKEAEKEKLIAELKGQHFYDLPDAWQLDPEIQPLAQAQQQLAGEADFWQKQLAAIDRQEKIQLLVVGQDGKPTLTQPLDPEPEHRALITRQMHDALTKHAQVSNQLTQNVQNFKARYQGWDDMVTEQTQKVFGAHEKHLKAQRDAILQQFPAALRHKPIYTYAANATAAIAMLLRDNEAMKKKLTGQVLNQPALASATPKPAATATGGNSMSGLQKLIAASGKNIQLPRVA